MGKSRVEGKRDRYGVHTSIYLGLYCCTSSPAIDGISAAVTAAVEEDEAMLQANVRIEGG